MNGRWNTRDEGERVRGWVLYDARCPLCARGARRLGPIVVRRGYRLAPLQRKWVVERMGMDEPRRMSRTWVLYADGRVVGGVDAYLELSAGVWWAKPLAWIGRTRLGYRLLDRLYFWVARNRQCISGVCGLRHGPGRNVMRREDATAEIAERALEGRNRRRRIHR